MSTLPQVAILLDPEAAVEGGETTTLSFTLDRPAPADGLEVQFRVLSSDGAPGDGTFPPELLVNVAGFNPVAFLPNGDAVFAVRVAPGATFASLQIAFVKDAITEAPEIEPLILVPSDRYSIDPFNSFVTISILDFPTTATVLGTAGNDALNGTAAAEFIRGLAGNDIINGNGGNDLLEGNAGDDILTGSSVRELLNGGAGNDTLYGNGGEDVLIGNAGDDLIYGGSSGDRIEAGLGNDTIYGNGGADLISSGAGLDVVWLGSGAATVVLKTGEGFDVINGFQGGATRFQVGSLNGLSFADSAQGAQIFQGNDLLATVSWTSAIALQNNIGSFFVARSTS